MFGCGGWREGLPVLSHTDYSSSSQPRLNFHLSIYGGRICLLMRSKGVLTGVGGDGGCFVAWKVWGGGGAYDYLTPCFGGK